MLDETKDQHQVWILGLARCHMSMDCARSCLQTMYFRRLHSSSDSSVHIVEAFVFAPASRRLLLGGAHFGEDAGTSQGDNITLRRPSSILPSILSSILSSILQRRPPAPEKFRGK